LKNELTSVLCKITMKLMKRLLKFNDTQIRAIANLLLEIGKWLLVTVVLTAVFAQKNQAIDWESVTRCSIYALIIIVTAIWMLKGVKKHE